MHSNNIFLSYTLYPQRGMLKIPARYFLDYRMYWVESGEFIHNHLKYFTIVYKRYRGHSSYVHISIC